MPFEDKASFLCVGLDPDPGEDAAATLGSGPDAVLRL